MCIQDAPSLGSRRMLPALFDSTRKGTLPHSFGGHAWGHLCLTLLACLQGQGHPRLTCAKRLIPSTRKWVTAVASGPTKS